MKEEMTFLEFTKEYLGNPLYNQNFTSILALVLASCVISGINSFEDKKDIKNYNNTTETTSSYDIEYSTISIKLLNYLKENPNEIKHVDFVIDASTGEILYYKMIAPAMEDGKIIDNKYTVYTIDCETAKNLDVNKEREKVKVKKFIYEKNSN